MLAPPGEGTGGKLFIVHLLNQRAVKTFYPVDPEILYLCEKRAALCRLPCYRAAFLTEITAPDGTVLPQDFLLLYAQLPLLLGQRGKAEEFLCLLPGADRTAGAAMHAKRRALSLGKLPLFLRQIRGDFCEKNKGGIRLCQKQTVVPPDAEPGLYMRFHLIIRGLVGKAGEVIPGVRFPEQRKKTRKKRVAVGVIIRGGGVGGKILRIS